MGRLATAQWGNNGMGAAPPSEVPAPSPQPAAVADDTEIASNPAETSNDRSSETEDTDMTMAKKAAKAAVSPIGILNVSPRRSITLPDEQPQPNDTPQPENEELEEIKISVPKMVRKAEDELLKAGKAGAKVGAQAAGPVYALDSSKHAKKKEETSVKTAATGSSFLGSLEDSESGQQGQQSQQQQEEGALPGAFPHGSRFGNSSLFGSGEMSHASEPQSATNDNNSRRGLVEANPVSDSRHFDLISDSRAFAPEDLEVATPHVENKQSPEQDQEKKSLQVLVLLLCILVVVLFVAALLLGLVDRSSDTGGDKEQAAATAVAITSTKAKQLLSILPMGTQEIIRNNLRPPFSPQSKAFQWLLGDPTLQDYSPDRLLQRYAMATIYYSTNGPDWIDHGGDGVIQKELFGMDGNPLGQIPGSYPPPRTIAGLRSVPNTINITSASWLSYDDHECEWFNVRPTCPTDHETVELLDLLKNGLTGSLPEEMALLTNLRAWSSHTNEIGGNLLPQLFSLRNLTEIRFDQNSLTGTIPTEVGLASNSIQHLSFPGNQMEGTIPEEIWKLSLLEYLVIGRNPGLSGTIPEDIGQLLPRLVFLKIEGTSLTGTIPTSLALMSDLSDLVLGKTQLSGTLPTELGSMKALKAIIFPVTPLLSGSLPSEIGQLENVKDVVLEGSAGVTGTIPETWSALNATLLGLVIKGTGITETIPPALCGISKLVFDCSDTLCGCSCPCFNRTI